MNRRHFLAGAAAFCPLCAGLGGAGPAHPAESGHGWSYEGAEGPAAWGRLAPEYAACGGGSRQSPIDLAAAIPAALEPAQVVWRTSDAYEVANNGHTIQVSWPGGSHLELRGRRFQLLQFHFHHASEHTLAGRRFPMEAHFVHRGEDGGLAVLGVFLQAGAAHPDLATIWSLAPREAGKAVGAAPLDPRRLLPATTAAYLYSGSLTTPPCAEIVTWIVLEAPVAVSEAQIAAFAALFPNNARPVQPLNGRFLLRTGA